MKKLYLPKIFFDSCSFYPPQKDEKIAMSKIEKIVGSYEELAIEIPYSVKTELSKAPKWIEKKISMSIYTLPVSLTDEERNIIQEIRIILFGKNALLENNQEMDVIHLFEAQKYGCRYFITLDKMHLLSKGNEIHRRFQLIVATPSEYLAILEDLLRRS